MERELNVKPRILVVDDEPFYLKLLAGSLSSEFQISVAKSGQQALRRAQGTARPDLILLDVMMPEMDGYAVCRSLKNNVLTRRIPVIFLTAKQDEADELKGFDLGAVDYVTKPISLPVLETRVRNQISLSEQRFALEQLVRERTREIDRAKGAVIYSMSALAEARDKQTGNHVLRTEKYVKILAEELSKTGKYQGLLDPITINAIHRAAPLHDIGKVGVPDRVLQKKGRLEEEERKEMERHVQYGLQALERAETELGSTPFIQVAKELISGHHEKWDGSGYPQGISGRDIPLPARLMAVADVYDAMVSRRYYKEPMPHKDVVSKIQQASGSHFDPDVVAVFIENHRRFEEIYKQYGDG
jgi:putative two-component system response regulator